jgi:PII-like signaling protein
MRQKVWNLTIRIKKNDELRGNRLENVLIDFLTQAGISGATVWTGVNGFGKRGKSAVKLEGLTINMPLLVEVIDTKEKLEPLLPQLKRMVDDNGLITLHEEEML